MIVPELGCLLSVHLPSHVRDFFLTEAAAPATAYYDSPLFTNRDFP